MNYEVLIKENKKKIENSFNEIGSEIKNPTMIDMYLKVATSKAMRFIDAIIFLCKKNFVNESLPILRSLIEHSINMRWIMEKDTNNRLKDYLSDFSKNKLGERWTNTDLLKRMEEIGFKKNRDYYDFVVRHTYSFAHVNASSLDWHEVISELSKDRMSPNAIYSIVAQMLGHIVKALSIHYGDSFNFYNAIWDKIKVDRTVREKFEIISKKYGVH